VADPSIEDWFAINALFTRYGCALDHGDVETVVACFSDTATLERPILGTLVGHAGVRAFAERTARAQREHAAKAGRRMELRAPIGQDGSLVFRGHVNSRVVSSFA
jgi:SnoaL-like domain